MCGYWLCTNKTDMLKSTTTLYILLFLLLLNSSYLIFDTGAASSVSYLWIYSWYQGCCLKINNCVYDLCNVYIFCKLNMTHTHTDTE